MFNVGDIVECIDDRPHKGFVNVKLTLNKLYTIAGFASNGECYLHNENYAWLASRFRYPLKNNSCDAISTSPDIDYFSITKDVVSN